MEIAAVSFAAASMIHFGVAIPLSFTRIYDPFAGAAVPEAVLDAALATGPVALLARWSARWWAAFVTTLFALLVTLYGFA